MPSPVVLSQATFPSFVKSRAAVIVRVTDGNSSVPDKVVDYFETEYPGAFAFGSLSRSAVAVDEWWKKHFRKGAYRASGAVRDGQVGFHLFIDGKPECFCKGDSSNDAGTLLAGAALVGLLEKDFSKGLEAAKQAAEASDADAVIKSFERHIGTWSRIREPIEAAAERGRAERDARTKKAFEDLKEKFKAKPEASPPKSQAPKDPYEVLGISRSATDAECKRAYHERAMKNAPDKVAQMDPEFQALANERLKDINVAWEAIKKQRGL